MASLAPEVRFSIRTLRIIWIAVFITHAVTGFLLYRWRAPSHDSPASLAGSDWIVFGIPFWLAFAAYFTVFTFSPYLRPRSVYRYVGLTALEDNTIRHREHRDRQPCARTPLPINEKSPALRFAQGLRRSPEISCI